MDPRPVVVVTAAVAAVSNSKDTRAARSADCLAYNEMVRQEVPRIFEKFARAISSMNPSPSVPESLIALPIRFHITSPSASPAGRRWRLYDALRDQAQ